MSALSYGYLTIIFPNEPWRLLQVTGRRFRHSSLLITQALRVF